MGQARPILKKLRASDTTRKCVETAMILSTSESPQQRSHAYGFMESAILQLRKDRKDKRLREEVLTNHNLGQRQDGSLQSTRNQQPYKNIGYMTTSGQFPMQGMNNTINQWGIQGLDPSVTSKIMEMIQYTTQREFAKIVPSFDKVIQQQKEIITNQGNTINKQSKVINNFSRRLKEVENQNMHLDLENKTNHAKSLPVISKPVSPIHESVTPTGQIHDGSTDNYQPNTHHQTHAIQQTGRDIENMDKELTKKRIEDASIYT